MKTNFTYIHSDFTVKELYNIRLKNFQREETVPAQMFYPELTTWHIMYTFCWGWWIGFSPVSMAKWPYNDITELYLQQNVSPQQGSGVNEKTDTIFLWDVGGRKFPLTPLFIKAR